MTETTEAVESVSGDRRFEILVDAVTDYAIYMLDTAGCVANWNTGAERIKGYAASEIIGRHFSVFYTDEDRAACVPERALAEALARGKFEGEGWRIRKDGTRFWANAVIEAIRGPARAAARLRQGDARRERAARGAGNLGAHAPGALPVAEDGGGGPAHRRHRARLQQPAHGDFRQPRADPAAPRGARARAALRRQRAGRGRARRAPDAAAPELRPAPVAPSRAARHQRPHRQLRGRVAARVQRDGRVRSGARSAAAAGADRCGAARGEPAQSRDERARRHAEGRQAHDRDGERRARRGRGGGGRRAAGPLRAHHRRRHRHGHVARDARARLRAVLHDQARGARQRPRLEPGLWLRHAVGRRGDARKRRRPRQQRVRAVAGARCAGRDATLRARPRAPRRRTAATARCSSSRTTPTCCGSRSKR